MTWSYNNDPSGSDIDAVHFLIGDTDPAKQLVSNEEIAYLLFRNSSVLFAAAAAADRLYQGYLATSGRKRVGDVQVDNSHLADVWRQRATDLRARASREPVGMGVGGTSLSDLHAKDDDTDAVQPMFRRDSDDHPLTSDARPPQTVWTNWS